MKALGHGANVVEMAVAYGKATEEIIDFSSNINPKVPEGLERQLKEALCKAVAYPDIHYTQLRSEIGAYLGVAADEIIVGNGATEVMYLLMKALSEELPNGGTLGIVNPTFSEYERSSRLSGMSIYDFQLEEVHTSEGISSFEINEAQIKEGLEKIDALFICNPNNPTGNAAHIEGILEMMREQGKLLIVDETFIEFIAEEEKYSLVGKIKAFNNLIIIKAVTKFFGLPGLRLGYGVSSNQELLEAMYDYKEPWTVNSFAETLTPALLQDTDYIKESKAYFDRERKRVLEALKRIKGLRAYETDTNFILLKLEKFKACVLKQTLFEKYDLLIRDASNFKGLDEHFIRIAVKTEEENNKLIAALRKEIDHELY